MIKFQKRGDEYICSCPWCGDVGNEYHHKHFSVNVKLRVFKCWICGRAGNLDRLKREHPEIIRVLRGLEIKAYVESKQVHTRKAPEERATLKEAKLLSGKIKFSVKQEAIAYCRLRGMSDNVIKDTRVVWSPVWKNRIIFPCYENGEYVYYTGRLFRGSGAKWRVPSKTEKGIIPGMEVVYRIDEFDKPDLTISICEGVFDALATNGIALLGKKISNIQIRKILNLQPKKLIIAFDVDAQKEAEELYKKLRYVIPTEIIFPPNGHKDWGETLKCTTN